MQSLQVFDFEAVLGICDADLLFQFSGFGGIETWQARLTKKLGVSNSCEETSQRRVCYFGMTFSCCCAATKYFVCLSSLMVFLFWLGLLSLFISCWSVEGVLSF